MTSIQTIFILVQFSPILRKRKKKTCKKENNSKKSNKKRENIIGTSEKTKHKISREKRQKNKKVTALVNPFTKG